MFQFGEQKKRTPFAKFFYLLIFKMLHIITLNLLFILTSIPVITIPQSIAALNKAMQHLISEKETSVLKIYFKALKNDILPTFITGFLTIGILAGLAYGTYFYYLNATRFIYLFFTFLLIVIFIIIYAMSLYAFQMLVSVKLPLRVIYKNAFILTFTQPKQTVLGAFSSLMVLVISILYFPYSIPLLALIVFSVSAFIATFTCYPVIKTKIITQEKL